MRLRSSCVFVVPGSIETRTGGYEYDRRIIASLRATGWSVDVVELPGDFPTPSPAALAEASAALARIPDDTLVVADGLAFGVLPHHAAAEAGRLRLVALVHMPLADAIGLDSGTAACLEASERRALASAAGAVVTGRSTVERVVRYGVRAERIEVVEPGTDPAPIAAGSGAAPAVHFVCVAAVTRGKGHLQLIDALARLPHRAWRLTCAGSVDRDPTAADRVRTRIHEHDLEDRVTLAGELDAAGIARLFHAADVFALATLRETYGMAVAEALARGLPVVSTRTGAIPDLIGPPANAAGLLANPGDVGQLADALARVTSDECLRRRLAEGARQARLRLPTWHDAGRRMAAALERLSQHA